MTKEGQTNEIEEVEWIWVAFNGARSKETGNSIGNNLKRLHVCNPEIDEYVDHELHADLSGGHFGI